MAGKTGTAGAGKGHGDHAWFAGYVPAERPKLAFLVVLEHRGRCRHCRRPDRQAAGDPDAAIGNAIKKRTAKFAIGFASALGVVEVRPRD